MYSNLVDDNNFNAWTAGFWEGEGTIYKCKKRNGYTISIAQAIQHNRRTWKMMGLLKEKFGGNIYTKKYRCPKYKPQLQWIMNKRDDVIKFINAIYPYCRFRKKELNSCLLFFENHAPYRKIVDMKKLITLRKEGKGYGAIGKEMNIHLGVVRNRIREFRREFGYDPKPGWRVPGRPTAALNWLKAP